MSLALPLSALSNFGQVMALLCASVSLSAPGGLQSSDLAEAGTVESGDQLSTFPVLEAQEQDWGGRRRLPRG